MKSLSRTLLRSVLLLCLCVGLLTGCAVIAPVVSSTSSTPEGTSGSTISTTTATVSLPKEQLAELLLDAAQNATGQRYSVAEWIAEWGLTNFWDDKLEAVEQLYSVYYVGDMPDDLTVARELMSLFCEFLLESTDLGDEVAVTDALITCYLAAVGDKYAYYMNEEDYASYSSETSGVYEGIGVSVVYDATEGTIEVISVFSGSPAEEAGIRMGDRIVAVEGESVRELGYYEAIDRVRGEVGTTVSLTVERDGRLIDFVCTRRQVTEETVFYRMQTDKVGYVQITTFSEVTAGQFKTAVDTLIRAGAESLIFDLRNNGGGLLTSILEILDYLLPDGYPLANYVYYDGSTEADYGKDGHLVDLPFAVLCNEYTASAAELFTSALKDYNEKGLVEATVVGTRTYGKGMMQSLVTFIDDTALTISIAYYQPPYSPNYEGVGVLPHRTVRLEEGLENLNINTLTPEQDTQLTCAIALMEAAD